MTTHPPQSPPSHRLHRCGMRTSIHPSNAVEHKNRAWEGNHSRHAAGASKFRHVIRSSMPVYCQTCRVWGQKYACPNVCKGDERCPTHPHKPAPFLERKRGTVLKHNKAKPARKDIFMSPHPKSTTAVRARALTRSPTVVQLASSPCCSHSVHTAVHTNTLLPTAAGDPLYCL